MDDIVVDSFWGNPCNNSQSTCSSTHRVCGQWLTLNSEECVHFFIIHVHVATKKTDLVLQWCLPYWLLVDGQQIPSRTLYQGHQSWSACATQPYRIVIRCLS